MWLVVKGILCEILLYLHVHLIFSYLIEPCSSRVNLDRVFTLYQELHKCQPILKLLALHYKKVKSGCLSEVEWKVGQPQVGKDLEEFYRYFGCIAMWILSF